MQHPFRLSILALSLGLAPALALADSAGAAGADSNAAILKQIEEMKAQIQALEAKVQEQQQKIDDTAATASDADQTANHADVQVAGMKQASEKSGLKGLSITGMISPAYIVNRDQDTGSFVFLNRSNGSPSGATLYEYDNSSFGQAYIQFQKVTDDGTKWTLNLAPDRGTGANMNGQSIINEASISTPIGGDPTRRFIAGQIPDWEGYESVFDNQTKSITHNLLYDFTEFFAYTGAGIDFTNSDGSLEFRSMLANANSARYYYQSTRGGHAPALIARLDYSVPGYDSFGVGAWGLVGKTPNAITGGTSDTQMFEADTYYNKGAWGLYGQIGVGREANASYNAQTLGDNSAAQWWGVSAMATYNFTPRFLGYARGDYLNDHANGGGVLGGYTQDSISGYGPDPTVGSGPGANRYALTFGMNYAYNQSTTFKLEYRYDGANLPVFYNVQDASYRKNNSLFGASVVVSF